MSNCGHRRTTHPPLLWAPPLPLPGARPAPSRDTRPDARVGDAQREATGSLLTQAYASGYLDPVELDTRLDTLLTARTVGGLDAVLADLPVAELRRRDPARRVARARAALRGVRAHAAAWVGMSVLVTVIWLVLALSVGAWYPWPVWPVLGGLIGLVAHRLGVRPVLASV